MLRNLVSDLRAARWAIWELQRLRRGLQRNGLRHRVGEPPSDWGIRGVLSVLHRMNATCLERSMILQRGKAARGEQCNVVVGIARAGGLSAHAWLEGEDERWAGEYAELLRFALPHTAGSQGTEISRRG